MAQVLKDCTMLLVVGLLVWTCQNVVRPNVEILCTGTWTYPGVCVEPDCANYGSCGLNKGFYAQCENVSPGMRWSEVQYRLGDPSRPTDVGFVYGGLGPSLEVRVDDTRAVAFRVGAFVHSDSESESAWVWQAWQADARRAVDCNFYPSCEDSADPRNSHLLEPGHACLPVSTE